MIKQTSKELKNKKNENEIRKLNQIYEQAFNEKLFFIGFELQF